MFTPVNKTNVCLAYYNYMHVQWCSFKHLALPLIASEVALIKKLNLALIIVEYVIVCSVFLAVE